MEFSVMASSFLQPSMLLCGTSEGSLYYLDALNQRYKALPTAKLCNYSSGAEERPSDLLQSTCRQEGNDVKNLILARYPNLFKQGICCIEYHPRLPSLVAIGLSDGSVHLLFLEAENLGLKKTTFLFKLSRPVNQLQWVLVDAVKDSENCKMHSTSFVDRIWKVISKSPYHSILVGRSVEELRLVVVERNIKVVNLFTNSTYSSWVPEDGHVSKHNAEDINAENHAEGDTQNQYIDTSISNDIARLSGGICLISTLKWPIAEYFEEDLEYPTLTNFCKVQESLCVFSHRLNYMHMDIYVPRAECGNVEFLRFRRRLKMRVRGMPTSVQITPKQYNQFNRYLSTNGEHMFSLNGEKCLNALGEFIAIGTNEGYVYTTSMLHIYNVVHAAIRTDECKRQSDSGVPDHHGTVVKCATSPHAYQLNNGEVTNAPLGAEPYRNADEIDFIDQKMDQLESSSFLNAHGSATDLGAVDIEMSSCFVGLPIVALKWALIWNDFTSAPHIIEPTQCCCTDDIVFLLSVLTNEHVDLLRLSKEGFSLQISNCKRLQVCCNSIHWVENTIPNDMTILMATEDGIEGLTCNYDSVKC
ncbi:hypothetical protein X943_002361 [Babesia divergens]|uniref:Uncharacterized protein n=1 Tax=Babesia divergens TaxID=32595 RepID=A0AAD9LK72_BABDI|nr:hypothetical protein X943_002361 [Babesia divergens]